MFITKFKVNFFYKPAIYVYLTNLGISKKFLNAISPVRTKREHVYNIMITNSSEQLAHQYCNPPSQYCSQKNIWFGSKIAETKGTLARHIALMFTKRCLILLLSLKSTSLSLFLGVKMCQS